MTDTELKTLSDEVLDLLKKVVGMEAFTREYAACAKQLGDKREARKQQKAAEVRDTFAEKCASAEFGPGSSKFSSSNVFKTSGGRAVGVHAIQMSCGICSFSCQFARNFLLDNLRTYWLFGFLFVECVKTGVRCEKKNQEKLEESGSKETENRRNETLQKQKEESFAVIPGTVYGCGGINKLFAGANSD